MGNTESRKAYLAWARTMIPGLVEDDEDDVEDAEDDEDDAKEEDED